VLLYNAAQGQGMLLAWFLVSFLSIAFSATLGAILHGFLPDTERRIHKLVWRTIMASVGVTAVAAWVLGSLMLFGPAVTRYIGSAAVLFFVVYLVAIFSHHPAFSLAIGFYLPALVFLLIAFAVSWLRTGNLLISGGAAGMVLSLIAAWVQYRRIGLHSRWFNHNALYHLLQAIALVLVYLAAHEIIRAPPGSPL
jgi:hypothetical protein